MEGRFSGRVALVTGAGGSIGRSEAQVLADGGARVIVQDIDRASCLETVGLIAEKGGVAQPLVSDIADIAAFRAAVAGFDLDLGGVDILVNNHGIGGDDLYLEEIDEANYDRMFDVSAKAVFFATQAVVPAMKRKSYGKIINVSSMVGIVGWPTNSQYSGAKLALIGFARSWALELAAFGICVNTVIPSVTVPGMATKAWTQQQLDAYLQQSPIPMGRFASPKDVANLVAFFASSDSDHITGQAMSPNGGSYVGAM
jgi:NAD(P)-dependent dehydrogenase (short-subunit alcohol dehydrogenase family)